MFLAKWLLVGLFSIWPRRLFIQESQEEYLSPVVIHTIVFGEPLHKGNFLYVLFYPMNAKAVMISDTCAFTWVKGMLPLRSQGAIAWADQNSLGFSTRITDTCPADTITILTEKPMQGTIFAVEYVDRPNPEDFRPDIELPIPAGLQ